jgi:hypothetical protein
VGEMHTIKHNWTPLTNHPHITCLLLQLPNRRILRTLSLIQQSSRYLNNHFINWRSVLFLQYDFWPAGFFEDRYDADTVYETALWASASFGVLPSPRLSIGVLIRRPNISYPYQLLALILPPFPYSIFIASRLAVLTLRVLSRRLLHLSAHK